MRATKSQLCTMPTFLSRPLSSTLPHGLDLKIRLIVYAVGGGVALTFLAIVHFGNMWRVYHFAHATATVRQLEVGIYYGKRGQKYQYTIGELTFVRQHRGQTFRCDERVDLGDFPSKYAVGQQLDVVPRTGTCWHPLIVDMVNHWKR